jgi:hypothetical protein
MKRAMAIVVCGLIGVAAWARLDGSEAMKAIVGSYLEIQTQLVADRTDTIKTQAQLIAEQAGRMGPSGAEIAKAAAELQKAGDLKATRDAFGALSEAVIAAAKADGGKDLGNVKLAFCPMVKKRWLQKGDAIQNPYFGKSMADCGELKKLQ